MIHRPGHPGAGSLLVISGAALFGTVGTARLLGPAAPAVSVSAVRLALAAAVLLLLAGWHGAGPLVAASRLPAVWVAGVAQAAFNVTFFGAVTRSGVALGTLVAIGCTPVLTGLITRQVTRAWGMATGLALLGLAALLSGDLGSGANTSGVLFALGAAASYATFITASSALASSPVAMSAKVAAIFVVAALVLSPALGVSDLMWVTTAGGFWMTVYLAVAATVLAYNLFNRGLRTVEPGTAATFALVEPLVAAILGVAVLGEHLSPLSWLGAAVVLLALLLMVRVTAPPLVQHGAPRRATRRDRSASVLP